MTLFPENPLPPGDQIHPSAGDEPHPAETTELAAREPGENPPWGIGDLFRIAAVAIIFIGLFSIAAMGLALRHAAGQREVAAELARDPRVVIPAQFAAYLVVIAYMVSLVRSRRRPFWGSVRWNFPHLRWFGWAAMGVALALVVQSASSLLPIPKSLPIERYFRDTTGAWMMAVFGVSFAPLVEELFFRGFMYPALARRWGEFVGVVITAMLFALIHTSQLANAWAPLLLLFVVGVVLTVVRARTRSVGRTFMIHVGYNGTLFTILYFASDHFRHLEKVT